MVNRILTGIMARFMLAFVFIAIGGIGSFFSGSHQTSNGSGTATNPWSKDYVAPAPDATSGTSGRSYHSYQASTRYIDATQSDEDRRDEAFRRQRLRELRKDYELRNGSVVMPGDR